MSLKDVLLQDMKAAMKEKDVLRKNAIQMTRAAILQIEKDKQITLDDEAVIEVPNTNSSITYGMSGL